MCVLAPSPHDENLPVIEQSSDKTLIYTDAFDFSKHRLDSAPLNESDLDDHALVGNAEFRRRFREVDPEESRNRHDEASNAKPPHVQCESGDCHAREQCAEQVRWKKGKPVQASPVLDCLAWEKMRLCVRHAPV